MRPGCCPGAARGRIPGSWAPGDRRQPRSSRTSPGSPGTRGSLIVADTQPFPRHVRGVGGTWDAGWPREPLWLQPTCPHLHLLPPEDGSWFMPSAGWGSPNGALPAHREERMGGGSVCPASRWPLTPAEVTVTSFPPPRLRIGPHPREPLCSSRLSAWPRVCPCH